MTVSREHTKRRPGARVSISDVSCMYDRSSADEQILQPLACRIRRMGNVERLYVLPEVAPLFQVSVRTVRAWIGSGRLASVRVGRRYLVTRDAINDLLRRCGKPAIDASHPTPPPPPPRKQAQPGSMPPPAA